jgi:hypothetical protein
MRYPVLDNLHRNGTRYVPGDTVLLADAAAIARLQELGVIGAALPVPVPEPKIPHAPERPDAPPGEAAESAADSTGPSDFHGTPPPAALGAASAQEQKQQPEPEPAPPAGGATPRKRKPA